MEHMLFMTKTSKTINFTGQLFTKKKEKTCTHVTAVDNLFQPIAIYVHRIIYTYIYIYIDGLYIYTRGSINLTIYVCMDGSYTVYSIRLITPRVPLERVIIDTYIFVFRKRHHSDSSKSCPLA